MWDFCLFIGIIAVAIVISRWIEVRREIELAKYNINDDE